MHQFIRIKRVAIVSLPFSERVQNFLVIAMGTAQKKAMNGIHIYIYTLSSYYYFGVYLYISYMAQQTC